VVGAGELALAVEKLRRKGKKFEKQIGKFREVAYRQFKDKINSKTVTNIFGGEIVEYFEKGIKKFRVTGLHHKNALKQGIAEIIPGSKVELGNGVYMAKIRKKDATGNWATKRDNDGYSTFFPDSWDEERTLKEITFAFGNKVGELCRSSQFKGKTTEGIEIFFHLDSNGKIVSAFPNFPRHR